MAEFEMPIEEHLRSLSRRFGAVETKLESIDSKLETIDARLDSVDARLDSVDSRLDSVDAKLDSMDSRLGSMESRQDSMEARQNAMESKLSSMDSKLMSIDSTLSVTNAKLSSMESTMGSLQSTVGSLESKVDSISVGLDDTRQLMCGKFTMFVKIFLEDALFHIDTLKRIAILDRPADEAILPAHSLKSTTKQIGALQMSHMAERLEQRASQLAKSGAKAAALMPAAVQLERIYSELRNVLCHEIGIVPADLAIYETPLSAKVS